MFIFGLLLPFPVALADQVPVRHTEGRLHGFLLVRDTADQIIGSGDSIQFAEGNHLRSELRLHFKDGSLHEETAVFSQRRVFQLLTYHLIQKGRAFKHNTDMTMNVATGQVNVRYTDDDGKEKSSSDRLKLPPDLANGILPILMGDVDSKTPKTTLSMVVSTPKPRVVKLEISPLGEDSFSVAGSSFKATRYDVKMDIGGVAGAIAPIVGKQPPDMHIWMIEGKAPGFLRLDGALYEGGPIWRIELASPVWPKTEARDRK